VHLQKARSSLSHLREHGFSECILELKFLDGVPPSGTPITHPFVKLVEESARDLVKGIISVSSTGTGPMYYFD
jgi:hypothetical protein